MNNKINKIQYANVSKLHEFCNKFDENSSIKIFYIIGKFVFINFYANNFGKKNDERYLSCFIANFTHKFFTKTSQIFKWQLQNNRFTGKNYFIQIFLNHFSRLCR